MLIATLMLAQVTVAVEVEAPAGDLYVQLCSEATYLQSACEHQAVKPAEARVAFTFEDVAPGRWAVMAWRDPEADGEMARALFGIPAEPTAIYGDPRGFFGPPGFEAAAVSVGDGPRRFEMTID